MSDDGTSFLPAGTLCRFQDVVDAPELNDRVCTVVGEPYALDDGRDWYWYDAGWAAIENPGVALMAQRSVLRPIAPGASAPAEQESATAR
jgi:hypothetical protein